MTPDIIRTPEVIAAEIITIRDNAAKVLLSASIQIGDRLKEAKEKVPYGEWANWLESNFAYSQSTANNLMAIATEYKDSQLNMLSAKSKEELYGKLTYSQAVALLPLSEAEREEFVESHDVENMSVRDINAALKAQKAAEDKAAELESKMSDAEKSYQAEIDKLNAYIDNQKKEIEEAKKVEVIGLTEKQVEIEKQKAVAKIKKENDKQVAKLVEELKQAKADALKTEEEISKAREEMSKNMEAEISKRLEKATAEKAAEIEALKKKAAIGADKALAKFSVLFEDYQRIFSEMLSSLGKIEDDEIKSKLRQGLEKLAKAQVERIKE